MPNIGRDGLVNYYGFKENIIVGYGAKIAKIEQIKSKKHPSILYADPACWAIVSSIENLLEDNKTFNDDFLKDINTNVGIITISNICTRCTIKQVIQSSQNGMVSPARFAAANPGSISGVSCIVYGLRGPSLTLTMSPSNGLWISALIAKSWISNELASHVLVNTYNIHDSGFHIVKSICVTNKCVEDIGKDYSDFLV